MSEVEGHPTPTAVAGLLASPGAVTCDEYWDYLVRATTHPSPAFSEWSPDAVIRFPLLFSLKYILTKIIVDAEATSTIREIVGAYALTGFTGDEDQTAFIGILGKRPEYEQAFLELPDDRQRQARESLQALAQMSFLDVRQGRIHASINSGDADTIFDSLSPVGGPRAADRDKEVRRLASLFGDGTVADYFDYPSTTIDSVVESGFAEGGKVERSHFVIERNANLRKEFFKAKPTTACDVCVMDTLKSYPWTVGVLDVHHLLPLSAGTRVEGGNTTFEDLVAVCPTCHRAVHKFYSRWLKDHGQKDFSGADEAKGVYQNIKLQFPGYTHA